MAQESRLGFDGMAQDEDYIVITGAILIFLGVFIWRACNFLARHIDIQNEERQRFCLLVAQELDWLDKAIKENERAKEEFLPYKSPWEMRN